MQEIRGDMGRQLQTVLLETEVALSRHSSPVNDPKVEAAQFLSLNNLRLGQQRFTQRFLAEVLPRFTDRSLHPVIDSRHALADVAEAHRAAWQTLVLDSAPETVAALDGARLQWVSHIMKPALWQA